MWILGQGGFLGTAIARSAGNSGLSIFEGHPIPWNHSDLRSETMIQLADQFGRFSIGGNPVIVWAAGADGVSAHRDESEVESFRDFVEAISASSSLKSATVVVCSSAGGVYGASLHPPFSVSSTIAAANQYGANKIAIETMAQKELPNSMKVHIARITNLYGPWPGPRQGLVNRICTATATRKALQIYVPLDTVRDYIYVDDAAELLIMEFAAAESSRSVSLIGSGQNSSVGEVIKTVTNVAHRKVPITLAYLETTKLQPRDLRMSPSWRERSLPFAPMSLAEGVKRLFDSLVTVPRWD